MNRKHFRALFLFFLFFCSSLLIYRTVLSAGMVTDATGWMERVTVHPWYSFMTPWEDGIFKPFYQLSTSLLYHFLVGSPEIIGLIYLFIHCINATLVYYCFRSILSLWGIQYNNYYLICIVLIWLIHPYHNEVLIWKVCHHYLLVTFFLLTELWVFLKCIRTNQWSVRHTLLIIGLNLSALFLKEYGLILPFVFMIIGASYSFNVKARWGITLQASLAAFLSMILYGLIKLAFIPRDSFLMRFEGQAEYSFSTIMSNLQLYLVKYLFYLSHWNWDAKNALHNWSSNTPYVLAILLFLAVIIAWMRKRRITKPTILAIAFFLIALLAWTPTSTLYFYDMFWGGNNRYGYIGSIFLIWFLGMLIYQFPKVWRWLFVIFALVLNFMLIRPIINSWEDHYKIQSNLEKDFTKIIDSSGNEDIYILELPNNYRGIELYKSPRHLSTLKDQIQWINKVEIPQKVHEIDQYNMMTIHDGAFVRELGPLHWKVEFAQWGNWSWIGDMGASDYETEKYSVEYRDNGYHLFFKESIPPGRYLIQDGLSFKEWKWIKNVDE